MVNSSSQLRILLFMFLSSILPKSCTSSIRAAFMPRSRTELKSAVDACLKLLPKCDCSISSWEVSSVHNMKNMFRNAASFNQQLCGARWVHSQATKTDMFEGSSGSISTTVCTSTPPILALFSPQSKIELKSAVDAYMKQSGSRSDCPFGDGGSKRLFFNHQRKYE